MEIKLKELIESIEEDSIIFGGVNEEKILEIEKRLNVKLPNQYKEFLSNYGGGIFEGVEVYGANPKENIESTCIKNTIYFRENEDMPLNLIVIEVVGEYVYCVKSAIESDDESVYIWNSVNRTEEASEYSNFNDYLYNRINEML